MQDGFEMITIDDGNVDRRGFFCYMSKRKSPAYRQKRAWLASKGIFLQNGFVEIDQAPPSFQLLVHRFGSGPEPSFPDDWEARQARFEPGLTDVRAHQCPYLEAAEKAVLEIAAVRGIPARVVELCSSRAVQTQALSARCVYGLVLDGELVTAHSLQAKDVETQPDANPHRRSGD